MVWTWTATTATPVCFFTMVSGKQIMRVLWQSILCVVITAVLSTKAHTQPDVHPAEDLNVVPMQQRKPALQVLDAILSVGGGPYRTIRNEQYTTIFQPTASVDLYLIPGGLIGFIFGGHFGYADRFTQGISFGVRERLGFLSGTSYNTFTEISALFFDDKEFARSFETGLRVGLTTVWPWKTIGVNARLAAEYRGRSRASGIEPLKHLYWVGLEGGISFSLLREQRVLRWSDTVRSALKHVLTSDEAREIEGLSESELERWYDRYWAKQDLTPGTPLNEAREEFERRVQYANSAFAVLNRLGTETDMGRAYLIYGRPDVIEIGSSTARRELFYELWIYHNRLASQSTALFLFEASGAGEWKQIYSNVPSETKGRIPLSVPDHIYELLRRYK